MDAPKHFGGEINVDAMCSTQKRSKWGGKDTINVTCVSHDANLLTVQENTERTLLFSYRCKARKTMCTYSERSTSVGTNNGSCMPTYVHWICGNNIFTSERQGYQLTRTKRIRIIMKFGFLKQWQRPHSVQCNKKSGSTQRQPLHKVNMKR